MSQKMFFLFFFYEMLQTNQKVPAEGLKDKCRKTKVVKAGFQKRVKKRTFF